MAQELNIRLDPEDKKPLYRQIYEYIRGEIRSGGLEAGERLPSTRSLASGLHVARSTTELAYSQLLSEGYVRVKKNSGYYVNEIENLAALYFGEPGRDGIYSPEHNLNAARCIIHTAQGRMRPAQRMLFPARAVPGLPDRRKQGKLPGLIPARHRFPPCHRSENRASGTAASLIFPSATQRCRHFPTARGKRSCGKSW